MPKPPVREFDLKARIAKLKAAGFNFFEYKEDDDAEGEAGVELKPLSERIGQILKIVQSQPIKSTTMNYLILYDIANDKVRVMIARYLLSKGCIRIQKSVYLIHSEHKKFDEIHETLKEINDIYANKDSIILVPLNVSDARSMKLIGQNVDIGQIIDPPNTVFI